MASSQRYGHSGGCAAGRYFLPFLEARKSSEKALIAVIQEAWTVACRPAGSTI